MALNFNDANFTNYLNTLDSVGWTTFGNDVTNLGLVTAFGNRFNLTDRWTTALEQLPEAYTSEIANAMQYASGQMAAGSVLSAIGEATDYNPAGPAQSLTIKLTGVEVSFPPDIKLIFSIS